MSTTYQAYKDQGVQWGALESERKKRSGAIEAPTQSHFQNCYKEEREIGTKVSLLQNGHGYKVDYVITKLGQNPFELITNMSELNSKCEYGY